MRRRPDEMTRLELADVLVVRRETLETVVELGLEEVDVLAEIVVGPVAGRQRGDEREDFGGEEGREVLSRGDGEEVLRGSAGDSISEWRLRGLLAQEMLDARTHVVCG